MTDSLTACDPRVVFLVVVGLCSGAVLEQVVVGQAVVTSSPAFSANLESATPPTRLTHQKHKHPTGPVLLCFFENTEAAR